jgi:hypothetical protein
MGYSRNVGEPCLASVAAREDWSDIRDRLHLKSTGTAMILRSMSGGFVNNKSPPSSIPLKMTSLILAIVVGSSIGSEKTGLSAAQRNAPNIVLILADDKY